MEIPEIPVREVNLSEADVQRVATELDATPESRAEAGAVSQADVRQALVAVLPQPVPAVAPAQMTVPTTETVAKERVDALVSMAVTHGIDAAHAAASNDEPYVLDALHDALAGAVYDQLKAQGRL